jgi:hypothetical protein
LCYLSRKLGVGYCTYCWRHNFTILIVSGRINPSTTSTSGRRTCTWPTCKKKIATVCANPVCLAVRTKSNKQVCEGLPYCKDLYVLPGAWQSRAPLSTRNSGVPPLHCIAICRWRQMAIALFAREELNQTQARQVPMHGSMVLGTRRALSRRASSLASRATRSIAPTVRSRATHTVAVLVCLQSTKTFLAICAKLHLMTLTFPRRFLSFRQPLIGNLLRALIHCSFTNLIRATSALLSREALSSIAAVLMLPKMTVARFASTARMYPQFQFQLID